MLLLVQLSLFKKSVVRPVEWLTELERLRKDTSGRHVRSEGVHSQTPDKDSNVIF
jgi:hypothetical protein